MDLAILSGEMAPCTNMFFGVLLVSMIVFVDR